MEKARDRDPVAVLVMRDEPTFPGCVVECRLIGCPRRNTPERGKMFRHGRFIAVANRFILYKRYQDGRALNPEVLEQIRQFFVR